jgi:hypothetical protein
LAALAVVAGKGARDGAGNGYGEKSQGLSCALWFVLQKSREEGGSGEVRRWWRPRFSLFFFFAKGGGSRRERNQIRFRVLLLLFSPSKFFSASPL